MQEPSRADTLADPATMALVLAWIRSALGPSSAEDGLVTEVYRRVAQDCPRWLRAAPLAVQLKSLTVITVLNHGRGHGVEEQ
ncbi:MAG: hypothetical protein H0T54_02295 [Geodermatophilaceae bacterium]|nr:hypothetical protein [Geodermatophilaceae bacterium]